MLVKKKTEEAERKKAYKKRVLELLYPEEHSSSVSSVDQRGGSKPSSDSRSGTTPSEEKHSDALVVAEQVQPTQKIYGVSFPPAGFNPSLLCKERSQDRTSEMLHSLSEDQDLLNDDLSLRRNRRTCKRRKTSHDQQTTSFTAVNQDSTANKGKVTETVEATESMSKNKKRKLKKKLKNAKKKNNPSEFVYNDIRELRTDNVCSETQNTDEL